MSTYCPNFCRNPVYIHQLTLLATRQQQKTAFKWSSSHNQIHMHVIDNSSSTPKQLNFFQVSTNLSLQRVVFFPILCNIIDIIC